MCFNGTISFVSETYDACAMPNTPSEVTVYMYVKSDLSDGRVERALLRD